MDQNEIKLYQKKAEENQRLLKENPREYVRRLRAKAEEFVGQFKIQLLEEAARIERELF